MRLRVGSAGAASVSTGLPVLDHLLGLVAEYGSFELSFDVVPGGGVDAILEGARALGQELARPLRAGRGLAFAIVPSSEALAQVALEASEQSLVVSNVDMSDAHVAGLEIDVVARFLRELADGAGLNLHVRLLEGRETQHVLDAIFKALGIALGDACRPR